MSRYGYFVCIDCKVFFWLGKTLMSHDGDQDIVKSFHRGEASEPPNWARDTLNQVLWTMLAKHQGHMLRVVLDDEFEQLEVEDSYQEIGGDGINNIPLQAYLQT